MTASPRSELRARAYVVLPALLLQLSLTGCAVRADGPAPPVATVAPAAASSPSQGASSMHPLSVQAPADRPVEVRSRDRSEALMAAIAPYVAQARASYPGARRRFLEGLPAGQHFFVTTRLHDDEGHYEQVFIAVHRIEGGEISGAIQSDINLVKGFRLGQRHRFPEAEILDWLITHPDGSEEGNVVGKFLDTYHPPH